MTNEQQKLATRPFGLERQFEIYMAGLQGQKPIIPIAPDELERQASQKMSIEAQSYWSSMPETTEANRTALQRWRIIPRMLRDVSQRNLQIQLFGQTYPFPLLLAPIGVQSIIHPEAEVAVARAASSLGVPIILSTASSKSIEEVAEASGTAPRWFQLYWSKDNDLNASFVKRAEQAGYSAIVVTLDTRLLSWREQDLQHAYLPFLQAEGLANYFSDPVFRNALPQPPEENPFNAIRHFIDIFLTPALTWQDLNFLRQHTTLPVLLKGILHPDDARLALEQGVDGLIVSNHGGRQLEGARAAIDALPDIVDVVQERVPVLFDSGIRRGADIIKALALGAQAVLLGRPYTWGLALAGEQGVREVVRNLLADLDLTLALSGYASIKSLERAMIVQE